MQKMSPGTPEGGVSGAKPGSSVLAFAVRHPNTALVIGALLLALGSTAWFLLQSPNFYSGYDYARMHSYYKGFYRASLLAGRAPLWNPYSGLGRPFMADIETATFYPPTLLVLPFGVPGGMALLVLFHQALAIVGGVRLGRFLGASVGASWILGAGVALSGAFTSRLSVGIVEGYFTLCWFPMLLWLGARLEDGWDPRVAAAFSLSVGLSILTGQPPLLYVVFLGLAFFLVFRMDVGPGGLGSRKGWANLAGLVGSGLLGIGLAAATLLPFFELIGQGNRPLHSPNFADANGMPAPSWLSLLVPTSQTFAPNWEYGIHCGLIPLLAGVGGILFWRDRNVRALLLMGLMGGLMASGDRGPFLRWLMHVFPGVSALRIPSRYGLLVAMAVLGLAAVSLSRKARGQALLVIPMVLVGVGWILWLGARTGTGPGFQVACISAIVGAGLLVGLWHLRGRLNAGAVAVLIGVFCAANWFLGIALQSPVYSQYGYSSAERAVRESLEAQGLLGADKAPPRIAFNPSDMRENAGMTGGFSSYNSYVAPSLARTWDYVHTAAHLKANPNDFINMPYDLGLAPLRWGSINLVATLDRASKTLVYAAHTDPRAYIAYVSEQIPDFHAANEAMASGHDFHKVALVEPGRGPVLAAGAADASGSAEITRFTPNQVVVHVRASAPGILVLAEAWYPGWSATIAGSNGEVFPVNGWMRGVQVPAGESDVVFTFHSRTLGVGLAISLGCAALMAALAAGWTAGKRKA